LLKNAIHFSPKQGTQSFSISGENLLSSLVLTVPKGLNINPSTIIPDLNGAIENQLITVAWEEGISENGTVNISGGGLADPKQVAISIGGFSEYCNSLLSQNNNKTENLAYMSVHLSGDKKILSFHIYPYDTAGTAIWGDNSIPLANIKLNNDEVADVTRTMSSDKKTITITFAASLEDEDVVTFGGPIVWGINYPNYSNSNCFIDPPKTYIVGLGCDLESPVWKGTSTDWSDSDNWSTGSVPGNNVHIVIPASSDYPAIPDKTTIKSLTFENGAGADIADGGSITVTEAVKVEYMVKKDRWYSVGFPFAIDYVYSERLGRDLVAYDKESGGHFWLKEYDGANNVFNFTKTIAANAGYIVQFPEYFNETKITFVSVPNQELSNSNDFDIDNKYKLQANPLITRYSLLAEGSERYYKYDSSDNKYKLLDESATLLPFESVVTYSNPANAPMLQTIGDGSQVVTSIAAPHPADDPVIALRYYTLYGVEIRQPIETGVYIVKKIHASHEEEIVKTVYIKK
jgi:hypothetical protein